MRTAALLLCAASTFPTAASADYKDDIGFRLLQQQLGAGMPTGVGVPVMQVEVGQLIGSTLTYLPDPGNGEFQGKTITARSGSTGGVYSGHATPVGQFFYGTSSGTATGISAIDAYQNSGWYFADYLKATDRNARPPVSSTALVANHSWVSSAAPYNVDILSRLDWAIHRDEFINVVGLNNGSPNPALVSAAYNVIAVGRTTGEHGRGTVALDATYTAGRVRPDVVAPADSTSLATPQVAAAAALLVQVGQNNAGLSTDPVSQSVTSRAGTLIRNAARTEVVKAALMAGASRATANTSTSDITDYRLAPANQSTNGLDIRFGAGQLNLLNSYAIIAGGEQNSLEDYAPGNGVVAASGFDYDPLFGGLSGSNATATYYLPVPATGSMLTVALVWNLKIDGGTSNTFNSTATYYNLELELFDVTNPSNWISVASSRGTLDNTENLWLPLAAGRKYALQVTRAAGQAAFEWDYALAWRAVSSPTADTDGDGVPDVTDNCILIANPGQCDSDGDGFGNHCDADLNNNLYTNAQDYLDLREQMGGPSVAPVYNIGDLNCNGWVNGQDYILFRQLIGPPPGPSGMATGE